MAHSGLWQRTILVVLNVRYAPVSGRSAKSGAKVRYRPIPDLRLVQVFDDKLSWVIIFLFLNAQVQMTFQEHEVSKI